MIKILWLEDEIQKIEAFFDRTYINGIELVHKDTANNLIAELNTNLEDYDAVIIDVMGIVNSFDEIPSSKAFKIAHEAILTLKHKKHVPFFVLSAQLTKDENLGLREYIGDCHIYIKSKDEERLINDIKKVVIDQPNFILRNKYSDILSVFNDKLIGKKHYNRIFNLIKWVESSEDIDNSEDLLTSVRKILEAIFHSLGKHALVPSEVINNQKWLNGTSLFLANKHTGFTHLETFIHPTASDLIFRLLNITQDASHAEGGLRLKIDEYIQLNKSDYLFKSSIYLLFEIIIWHKNITAKYNDFERNEKLWKALESSIVESIIIDKDSQGNYHCNNILITY
jgi:hypothetical protein